MNRMIYVVMLALLCACSSQTETEKHQVARNKVVEVKDKIKERGGIAVTSSSVQESPSAPGSCGPR